MGQARLQVRRFLVCLIIYKKAAEKAAILMVRDYFLS